MNNATFLTSRILTAVNAEMDNMRKEWEAEKENIILRKMQEKIYVFWGRTLTREEAIKSLNSDIWNDYNLSYYRFTWRGSGLAELKSLCEKTQAVYIELDAETVHRLDHLL